MKTLLYKQLRLVCHPMTPVFCLFGFMVIIPNYPYTVIFFYVMLGLFFTFLNMREQKDLYYTALLPVPKRDAVKAGCLFTALIELLSLAVLVPCALLAVRLQPGKDNLVGLDPNLALFAAGFLLYAVFNAVFLPSFYANGYKVGVAFVKAISEHEGISQRELAEGLHVKAPTVAVAVKRLEKGTRGRAPGGAPPAVFRRRCAALRHRHGAYVPEGGGAV